MVSWPENDITLDGWRVSTSSFCSKMMQKKIITATRAATLCRRCHLKPDREVEPQFRVPANTPACPISVQLLTMMFYHLFTASLKLNWSERSTPEHTVHQHDKNHQKWRLMWRILWIFILTHVPSNNIEGWRKWPARQPTTRPRARCLAIFWGVLVFSIFRNSQ